MSWASVPVIADQDIQDFDWCMQFWRAVRERVLAVTEYGGWAEGNPVFEDLAGADVVPPTNPAVGDRWLVLPRAANEPSYIYCRDISSTPPASPVAAGYPYGVLSSATGSWAGHDGHLAVWRSGPQEWRFYRPKQRHTYYSLDQYNVYVYADGVFGLVGSAASSQWRTHANMIATWTGTGWTFEYCPPMSINKPWRIYRAGGRYFYAGIGSSAQISELQPAKYGCPLNPVQLLFRLEAMPPYYTRANVDDYEGMSEPPGHYFYKDFWADVGVPTAVQPNEDLRILSTPPIKYVAHQVCEGVRFLVWENASGAWAGHEGEIATAHFDPPDYDTGLTWSFEAPLDGYLVAGRPWNINGYYRYNATSGEWVRVYDGVGWYLPYYRTILALDDDGESGQRARLKVESVITTTTKYFISVLSSPPAKFTNYNVFGVAAGATGAWAGQDGKLASWNGSQWVFTAPETGKAYLFGAVYDGTGLRVAHETYSKAYIAWQGDWIRYGPGYEYYEHDGTRWVLSADQTSPPDVVDSWRVGLASGTLDHEIPEFVIGPHLWDQIYTGCRLLHRRLTGPPETVSSIVHSDPEDREATGTSSVSMTDAKQEALDEWASASWTASGASGIGAYNYACKPSSYWEAFLYRKRGKMRAMYWRGLYTAILPRLVTVSFYGIARRNGEWFSAFGDGVLENTAVLLNRLELTAKALWYDTSDYVPGSDAAPSSPWFETDSRYKRGGWHVTYNGDAFAIEEWNVEGGFEYQ